MGQLGYSGAETALGKTTPATLRATIEAEFHNAASNPVIKGGKVTGRTDRSYAYEKGVGVLKTADGAVKLTWNAGVTALVAQPSVSRTDVIYVDADGAVKVGTEGAVNESTVIVIDRMVAPAGMTQTNQATRKYKRNYALPYGATLGWLGTWAHIGSGEVPKANTTICDFGIWVPTDRWVDIYVQQSIHGTVDYGLPDSDSRKLAWGAMAYKVFVDNVLLQAFEIEYTRFRSSHSHVIWAVNTDQGEHRIRVERAFTNVGADPIFYGGGVDKEAGNFVGVADRGVAE